MFLGDAVEHVAQAVVASRQDQRHARELGEAHAAAAARGLRLVPGIEISTRWGRHNLHLLGYFSLAALPRLEAWQAERRAARRRRLKLDPTAYPVFASLAEVPDALRDDPELVLERFVPELDEEGYVLRKAWYLGRRGISWRSHARSAVIKASGIRRRVVIEGDPTIDAWRTGIGLEFGKVDYVCPQGEAIPLDVNPTPGCVGTGLLPGVPPLLDVLAPGLDDLWP